MNQTVFFFIRVPVPRSLHLLVFEHFILRMAVSIVMTVSLFYLCDVIISIMEIPLYNVCVCVAVNVFARAVCCVGCGLCRDNDDDDDVNDDSGGAIVELKYHFGTNRR